MREKALEHWQGALFILVAMVSPWSMYVSGSASLYATVFGSCMGALTTILAWVNRSLADAQRRHQVELGLDTPDPTLPPTHKAFSSEDDTEPPCQASGGR